MLTPRAVAVLACAAALTACSHAEPAQPDIARVKELTSKFGVEFQVNTVGPTAIDPKLLQGQPMPPGVVVDPPDCTKFASGLDIPPGLQGNMAATTAEGSGSRYIVIAVETSQPLGFNDPGPGCQKVGYSDPNMRGQVEVVDAPTIEGARVLGTHRVVQTMVNGAPKTGELFNYVASFDTFMVLVTANPLVVPNGPVAPVDTQRARDLLTAGVAAVRGA